MSENQCTSTAYLVFKVSNSIWRSIFTNSIAGDVVLITGASSGIGEYMAYEYAKSGACLALIARRDYRLQIVADKARKLGSPDVIAIPSDVSNIDHCKRFVEETVNHFGRLDLLVNNAGVAPVCMFEDYTSVSADTSVMDINFWGSVYCTQFAIPHLRRSKGKIIVISSIAGWLPTPRLSIYCASKAALLLFFETLRIELGKDIGITVVCPGLIKSEITEGGFQSKVNVDFVPLESTEGCARAIVNSSRRGDRYLAEPAWIRVLFLMKQFLPDVVEWYERCSSLRLKQKEMDLVHKFLNVAVPILSLILAPFVLLPCLWFKFLKWCLKLILTENVAGKVVLITGASSGIGEHVAYEYARRRACLVLVARRKDRLDSIAAKVREIGSPDVLVIPADVSKLEDCRRFIDETIDHFGRLDHLVNNAGIVSFRFFEECKCVTDHASVMNTNFWGSVYCTQFAVPHLRKNKGKIVVIASTGAWFCLPTLSIYNASKAALISFFETLRTELGSDIGITIVTPGMVESEMTDEEFVSKANVKFVPKQSTKGCAKSIVKSAIRGDKYLTEPGWMKMVFLWKLFCPEVIQFGSSILAIGPKTSSKTTNGIPPAQSLQLKTD